MSPASSAVSTNFFTARGGRGNEGTIQIDGMNVGSAFNGGGVAGFGYPIGESSEIQVTIAGGLGETDRGGPAFNLIPKTGGNSVRDDSLPARQAAAKMIEAIRLTGQVSQRHKVGFYLDYQQVCNGSAYAKGAKQCRDRGDDWVAIGSVGAGFFGALAPEAGNVWDNREKITQTT